MRAEKTSPCCSPCSKKKKRNSFTGEAARGMVPSSLQCSFQNEAAKQLTRNTVMLRSMHLSVHRGNQLWGGKGKKKNKIIIKIKKKKLFPFFTWLHFDLLRCASFNVHTTPRGNLAPPPPAHSGRGPPEKGYRQRIGRHA